MIRGDGTIVLPRVSARADGIDPDIARGDGERAIFSYPGNVIPGVISGPWVAQCNVRLAKVIVVRNAGYLGWVGFWINDVPLDEIIRLSALNQQMAFTADYQLRAEIDTLKVHFGIDCDGSARDLSVFVSFTKVDPL